MPRKADAIPGDVNWSHAIIHLMPGLYSPGLHPTTYQQPTAGVRGYSRDNGLRANGEVFPLRLPPRVSLQGTSALNTIFDIGGATNPIAGGPAVQFGEKISGIEYNGDETVIDAVTFIGAFDGATMGGGSAIFIKGDVKATPTISNCFFIRNYCGIAVAASSSGNIVHDGTTIVNNTFAWNACGLWNGQELPFSGNGQGKSKLIVIMNIFDSRSPDSSRTYMQRKCAWPKMLDPKNLGQLGGAMCFLGMARDDLQIDVDPGAPVVYADTNAYEDSGVAGGKNWNTMGKPSAAFPQTAARAVGPSVAGINIAVYTGWSLNPPNKRGILYVRDLLCHAHLAGALFPTPPAGFDLSPLDFRLAPAAVPATSAALPLTPGTSGALNPLVDVGPETVGTGLAPRNGLPTLTNPPGSLTATVWPFHSWNFDCEGFGNPRGVDHPVWLQVQPGLNPLNDCGADELSELPIAGYRAGTTTFLKTNQHPVATQLGWNTNPPDNSYLWYLGPPDTLSLATVAHTGRPRYRAYPLGAVRPSKHFSATGTESWWANFTWNPSIPSPPNYYVATVAHITPHLLPDAHPMWAKLGLTTASWPYWKPNIGQAPCNISYNSLLYWDPTHGIINPPGTYDAGGNTQNRWLDEQTVIGTPLFSLFGFWATPQYFGGPATITDFDPWCRGGVGAARVDTLSETFANAKTPVAVRYSVETQYATWTGSGLASKHVQTFRVIVEGAAQ